MTIKAEYSSWRPSKYVDGPNSDGYYTAGIDVPQADIFGLPDWHYNAIEFHDKDRATAIQRRDDVLKAVNAGDR